MDRNLHAGGSLLLKRKRVRNIPFVPVRELSLKEIVQYGFPHDGMSEKMHKWKQNNLPHLWRGLQRETAARIAKIGYLSGHVCLTIVAPDGTREEYGLVSLRVITTVGAQQVVKAFLGTFSLNNFRYHALGSGSAEETIADTALTTEHSSLYDTSNTRTTGTLQQGVSATVFRTVGTTTLSGTALIAEFGLFSQAATNSGSPTGGYMFDRALITPETILVGYSLVSDYRLGVVSGT